jgi:hypothetical protein
LDKTRQIIYAKVDARRKGKTEEIGKLNKKSERA